MALPHFHGGKNLKKVDKYLDINEEPIYTQLKNDECNFILKNNFILEFMDKKVEDGELSKITKDNLPYFFSYKQNDLVRKLKIQKVINKYDINLIDRSCITVNGTDYKSITYQTNVVKKCSINNNPNLLDSDLNKILKFCKDSGITHIYEIIEKRFGVEVNKLDLSLTNISYISDFESFSLKRKDIIHKAYNIYENDSEGECIPEEDDGSYNKKDSYYDIDVNKLKYYENSIKDCYVFNEVNYSVRGIKTFDKELINEHTLCKLDFEYFKNNYIKKK